MPQILTDIVRHPSAWYGRDLAHDTSWIVHLEPRHLEEIAAAVASVKARGLPFAALHKRDFPLPTLAPATAHLAGRRHHRPRLLPAARPERAGLFRRGCRHDLLGHGPASRPGGHPEPEGRPFGTRLRPRPALWRSRRARLRDQRPPALPHRFRRCRRPPVPAPRRQRRPVQRRQRRHHSQRDPEAPSGVSRAALPRLPLYPPRSGAHRKPGDAAPPAGVRRARRPCKRSPHPQPDQRGLHQDRHPAEAHRTRRPRSVRRAGAGPRHPSRHGPARSATSSSATTT